MSKLTSYIYLYLSTSPLVYGFSNFAQLHSYTSQNMMIYIKLSANCIGLYTLYLKQFL